MIKVTNVACIVRHCNIKYSKMLKGRIWKSKTISFVDFLLLLTSNNNTYFFCKNFDMDAKGVEVGSKMSCQNSSHSVLYCSVWLVTRACILRAGSEYLGHIQSHSGQDRKWWHRGCGLWQLPQDWHGYPAHEKPGGE